MLTLDAVGAPALSFLVLAATEEDVDRLVAVLQFLHLFGELIVSLDVVCDHHDLAGISIHRAVASEYATENRWKRRDGELWSNWLLEGNGLLLIYQVF